ncbi:MAG: hypothetical protein KC645_12415 [Gemmatimonadetes bacterium]|nr:hypothetical protein [Gemmatimonadota bacterium]
MTRRLGVRCAGALLLLSGVGIRPAPAAGQGVVGTATSIVRYVGLQPLVLDSFAVSDAIPGPDGGFVVDGRPVSCVPGVICTAYGLGPGSHAALASQDVRLTAWGLGLPGLSATAFMRGRQQLDGGYAWPRGDDPFDLLLGYLQWNRPGLRVRLGRQETLSPLGFASFDGVSLLLAPAGRWRVEAFGGRSLARGLRSPRNEALQGLDDFVPLNEAWLFGGLATLAHRSGASLTLRYQREVWSDGSTLLNERASAEVRAPLGERLDLSAQGDWDLGLDRAGKASASLHGRVTGWMDAEVRVRRYVPYFDLSTVWGFFEPVGFTEITARGEARAGGNWSLWAAAGRRGYEDTRTVRVLGPVGDDAWTVDAGSRWRPEERWSLQAGYRLEWGAGAYLQSGDVSLAYTPSRRAEVTLHGSLYQQLEEFRLGDRRLGGGGVSTAFLVGERVRLRGGWMHHAVLGATRPDDLIGPQTRAWTALEVRLGQDPGLSTRRAR